MNLRDLIFHAEYQLHRDRGFAPADARAAALTIADKSEPASPLSSAIGMAQALHDLQAAGVSPKAVASITGVYDPKPDALQRVADKSKELERAHAFRRSMWRIADAAMQVAEEHEVPIDRMPPDPSSWLVDAGRLAINIARAVARRGPDKLLDEDALAYVLDERLGVPSDELAQAREVALPRPALYSTRQAIADAGLPVTLSAADAVKQLAAQRDENAAKYFALLADFDKLRSAHADLQRERDGLAQAYAATKVNG